MKRLINIYGSGKTRAVEYLDSLFLENKDEVIKRTKDTFETKEAVYRAFGLSQSDRGVKFHDAFVDKNITLGEYEDYIKYKQLRFFEEDAGFIRLFDI